MNDLPLPIPEPFQACVIHIDALPNGTRLAEFEILGLLGVGGFGMVYKAYDHSLQRIVAIKEYMPAAIVGRAAGLSLTIRSSIDQSSFSAGLTSFVAEARLLARFDHPSLAKVFRFWEANNTAYMAMPLYMGMTLKQARSQMRSPPPEAWLRQVLWSVLEALQVLHDNNTLHRDVSPDNIFLQDVGPPVLLDLGSARRAVLDAGQKHTAVLKVNYAPIEQYADSVDLVQGPWTDLYSVAAVIHGCLCNEPPLPATFRVLRDRMPTMVSVAETVKEHFGVSYSDEFVVALDQALSIQPDARPKNVAALAAQMRLNQPDDMLRFDWRADVSDLLVAPSESQLPLQEGASSSMQTILAEKTRVQTAIVDPKTNVQSDQPAGKDGKKSLKLTLLGLAAVLFIAAWFFLGQQRESEVVAAVVPPVVAGVPVSATQPGEADKPVASDPQLAASSPKPAVSVPQPVALPPVAAKPAASAPVKRIAPKLAPPPSSSAQKEKEKERTTPHPDEAVAVQKEEVAAPKAPVVLCADSNFITRPMCIYQECKKSQYAELAVCIESRRRYPDN